MAIEVAIKVRVRAAYPLDGMSLESFGRGVAKIEELKGAIEALGFESVVVESKMGNMRGDEPDASPAKRGGRRAR